MRSARRAKWIGTWLAAVCGLPGLGSAEEVGTNYTSHTTGAPGNATGAGMYGDTGKGEVGPGGTFSYAIPIEVPPGARGIAPKLALSYVGGGNGWIGAGWAVAGFSAVTRDTRFGIPRDLSNVGAGKFLLDGTPLVAVGGGRYRTELESYQHIYYDGSKWIVRAGDGSRAEYGERILAKAPHAADTTAEPPLLDGVNGVREWRLSRIVDSTGYNEIRFVYAYKPASKTVKYPYRVIWGSPLGSGGWSAVELVWQGRPDVTVSFASGAQVVEALRLQSVEVRLGTDANGAGGMPVRSYDLVYTVPASSGLSHLHSVTERGNAAGPTRTTQLAYTLHTVGFGDGSSSLAGLPFTPAGGGDASAAMHTRRSEAQCLVEDTSGQCWCNGSVYDGSSCGNYDTCSIDGVQIDCCSYIGFWTN